jgi:hypothetical protein
VIIVSPQQALDNLEQLSGNISFRYNLTLQSAATATATATATITADTLFGAMHGLEIEGTSYMPMHISVTGATFGICCHHYSRSRPFSCSH